MISGYGEIRGITMGHNDIKKIMEQSRLRDRVITLIVRKIKYKNEKPDVQYFIF
jgi:hypothetical protein